MTDEDKKYIKEAIDKLVGKETPPPMDFETLEAYNRLYLSSQIVYRRQEPK